MFFVKHFYSHDELKTNSDGSKASVVRFAMSAGRGEFRRGRLTGERTEQETRVSGDCFHHHGVSFYAICVVTVFLMHYTASCFYFSLLRICIQGIFVTVYICTSASRLVSSALARTDTLSLVVTAPSPFTSPRRRAAAIFSVRLFNCFALISLCTASALSYTFCASAFTVASPSIVDATYASVSARIAKCFFQHSFQGRFVAFHFKVCDRIDQVFVCTCDCFASSPFSRASFALLIASFSLAMESLVYLPSVSFSALRLRVSSGKLCLPFLPVWTVQPELCLFFASISA